ncbi:MAG: hypothetical protein ACRDIV_19360 [Ktedonobacteraceae bacterium]
MDRQTFPGFVQDRRAFEISPALETGSPTSLSTHWIPLHELLVHWTNMDTLLLSIPVAPLLTAIGHALFALSRETRALRLYTLAWQKQQWHAPARETTSLGTQAIRHLHEATHHWSRAAGALEMLLPTDLEPTALEHARRLSRVACTQQARLRNLSEEVYADVRAWHTPTKEVSA